MSIQSILKLAAIAALTVSTSAFYVGKDVADGVYMHYIDHAGRSIHRRIDDNSVARRFAFREAAANLNTTAMAARPKLMEERNKLVERYNPSVGANCAGCGDGIDMPTSDTDSANGAIDSACGSGTELVAGSDYYSKVGQSVAYVCAYMADQQCTAADRQATSGVITGNCGEYYPGWETPSETSCENGGSGIVYGYDHVENCFCFC